MSRQHPSIVRPRRALPALLVTGLLVASACGDNGGGDSTQGSAAGEGIDALGGNIVVGPLEDGDPVEGGSLIVGLEGETNTYMPASFQGTQAGFNVAYAVFDPLMIKNGEGEVEPYLAESLEPNDDFTEWTLTLRPDVTFHDGTPLDAEAMKTIFDDFLTAEGSLYAGILNREVSSLDVVGDLTVRYVLNQPNSAWHHRLVLPIGWPFSPTAAAQAGDDFGSQPVGTGPFRFVSWQRDGDLVLERNSDYWQPGLPYLDEITFRSIPDEESRAASLGSGDIDALQSVRLSSLLARVAGIDGVRVDIGFGNGGGNVIFNVNEPPVDDVRVRQALAHAVDQQALIEVVADEAAVATEPRSQGEWSGSPYYSEAVAEAWPEYNPERAQELYDDYVSDPNRSDGKDVGDPVSFTYGCTNVPALIEQATALQGFWDQIGFDVEVQPVEQSVHVTEAITGNYQAKCFRGGLDYDPLVVLEDTLGDPEETLLNVTDFTHPTIDRAFETLRSTDDLATRRAAVEEVGLLLAEEVPVYWTGSDLPFIAHREQVRGVAGWHLPDGSIGDGTSPGITFWSQVWIEEG